MIATEEGGSQESEAGEKVYPHPGVKPTTYITILAGGIIGLILGVLLRIYAVQITEALLDVAGGSTVNNFRNVGLGMIILFSSYLVVYLVLSIGGYHIKEIVLSKEGIVFRRKRNPIVIQRITNLKESRSGRILKLTGWTAGGDMVNRKFTWSDVGRKKWEEFKKDLQKIRLNN